MLFFPIYEVILQCVYLHAYLNYARCVLINLSSPYPRYSLINELFYAPRNIWETVDRNEEMDLLEGFSQDKQSK